MAGALSSHFQTFCRLWRHSVALFPYYFAILNINKCMEVIITYKLTSHWPFDEHEDSAGGATSRNFRNTSKVIWKELKIFWVCQNNKLTISCVYQFNKYRKILDFGQEKYSCFNSRWVNLHARILNKECFLVFWQTTVGLFPEILLLRTRIFSWIKNRNFAVLCLHGVFTSELTGLGEQRRPEIVFHLSFFEHLKSTRMKAES